MGWVGILSLIARIIVSIILLLVAAGTGLFGYIAWSARARKWGAGMFAIAAVCIFLFYWQMLGDPIGVI